MKIIPPASRGSSAISYAGLLEKIEILRSTLRWASTLARPEIEKLLRQANALRDEKLKVLHALRPIAGADVEKKTVRGQYKAGAIKGKPVPGYLEEPGVPADSRTETFVAL